MTTEDFKRMLENEFRQFFLAPQTSNNVTALNSVIAGQVKELCDAGRIVVGTNGDILLFDVPLDVLAFVPIALHLDHVGSHIVFADGERVGRVTYNGFPEQHPGNVTVGLDTAFQYLEPVAIFEWEAFLDEEGYEDEHEPLRAVQTQAELPRGLLPEAGLGERTGKEENT